MELFRQVFSSLLQQGPAETTNYMILGYAILFVILAVYLVSLYLRSRNLRRDVELLEEIEAQETSSENMNQVQVTT